MTPPVPSEINLQKLMAKLNAQFAPEFIPLIPEPYAKKEQCFVNVAEKVKRDGGSSHYGWAIFQADILCEGERHAVWKSSEGNLVDITPREPSMDQILFITDNNLEYKGQLIDNVRINTTSNSIVDDYILMLQAIEILFTYGTRKNEDEINLPREVLLLQCMCKETSATLMQYMAYGGTAETQCFCGDELKYKECHGKTLKEDVEFNLQKIDSMFPERPLK